MTDNPPPEDLLRYDILTQDALRGVIKRVLEEVAKGGLPGEHHFFITFDTRYKGVRLSPRMKERYPEEMTIVVQHTFWNLDVGEKQFEIDLSFDETRERLKVPYASIKGFFDPSVKFGLQFDLASDQIELVPDENLLEAIDSSKKGQDETIKLPIKAKSRELKTVQPDEKTRKPRKKSAGKGKKKSSGDKSDSSEETSGADVVSLDAFRKKK